MTSFTLTGIDDDGNVVVDVPLTPARAAALLLELVQSGAAKIVLADSNDEVDAAQQSARSVQPPKKQKKKAPSFTATGSFTEPGACPECGSMARHRSGCSKPDRNPKV